MATGMRVVGAGRGWQWLVEGYALFRRSPANWMALTVVFGVIWVSSLFVPLVGPLLFNLFSPLLFAGLMIGCRALEEGRPLEISHLFSAFKPHAGPLVTIGGVYLVGTIVVLGIVLMLAGPSVGALMKGSSDLETVRAAVRELAVALSIGAAIYLPLIMLIWFAPLLVVFDGMAPVPAMKLSFEACLKNTVPFLVYGLAILGAWIVLSVPAAFGPIGAALMIGALVLSIPVLICSIYASYKDVFQPERPAAAGGNPFLK
jgi:uncharacterized membrane protein